MKSTWTTWLISLAWVPFLLASPEVAANEKRKEALENQRASFRDRAQEVTVRLQAEATRGLALSVRPKVPALRHRPGVQATAHFRMRNLSNQPMTISAVLQITPPEAHAEIVEAKCVCLNPEKPIVLAPQEFRDFVLEYKVNDALEDHVDMVYLRLKFSEIATPR